MRSIWQATNEARNLLRTATELKVGCCTRNGNTSSKQKQKAKHSVINSLKAHPAAVGHSGMSSKPESSSGGAGR
jgi:hypothetical protein